MTDIVQNAVDCLLPVFKATDEALNEWNGEGCLQFPTLMLSLAMKMNWDEKKIRENDPFVRWYVRNHPDWHITRGAHGGIMRVEEKQKKEQLKVAKAQAKADMKAKIEADVEAKKLVQDTLVVDTSDNK